MRPEDSIYLAAGDAVTLTSSPRTTADLRTLLRLSTLLHSIRGLHDAQGKPTRDGLARLLLRLLLESFPADAGAILLDSGKPGDPFSLALQDESAAPFTASVKSATLAGP